MPVAIDTARSAAKLVLGGTASDSQSVSLNVNPNAPNLVAVVGVMFNSGGAADMTAATFTATFGGVAMTLAGHVEWNSNNCGIKLYTLAAPLTGARSAVASFSSMPTEALTRNLVVAAATYSGVATIGSAVDDTPATSVSNTVTVSSGNPCDRVIGLHGVSGTSGIPGFSAYNKIVRAHQHAVGFAGGDLALGDAPGAGSVTLTATQLSTALWGAIGLPMTAAPVVADAVLTMPKLSLAASGNVFRVASPSPERYWEIPARRT